MRASSVMQTRKPPVGGPVDLELGVLDFFSNPRQTRVLAGLAETLDYDRYWVGEHHTARQCADPLMMAAALAGATRRIRIGTGGVLLPIHNTVRLAVAARMVNFMFPGRLELGVTRGSGASSNSEGSTQPISQALRAEIPGGNNYDYDADCTRLCRLLGKGNADEQLDYLADDTPVFVLGVNPPAARLAGRLGAGFCFSFHHWAPTMAAPVHETITAYRDAFQKSAALEQPSVLAVVSGHIGGRKDELPGIRFEKPELFGDATRCWDTVQGAAELASADGILVLSLHSQDRIQDVISGIETLADARARG